MARILFAWEIGMGFGHLQHLVPLARRLHEGGHELLFLSPDPEESRRVLPEKEIRHQTFPRGAPPRGSRRPPLLLLEEIKRAVWSQPAATIAMLQRCRALLDEERPDLVISDYAPSLWAVLRDTKLPRVRVVPPMFSPPPTLPWPTMQPWFDIPKRLLLRREEQALEKLRPTWLAAGLRPLEEARRLHEGEEAFFPSFAELDPYGPERELHLGKVKRPFEGEKASGRPELDERLDDRKRHLECERPSGRPELDERLEDRKRHLECERPSGRPESFLGPLPPIVLPAPPSWPSGTGPRVFVYLQSDTPRLDELLGALTAREARVLLYLRGTWTGTLPAGVTPLKHPCDLRPLLAEADLVLSHGGHGLCHAALRAACPMLLLPRQLEQTVRSHRLIRMGLAAGRLPFDSCPPMAKWIDEALGDAGLRQRAADFARRHATHDEAAALDGLVHRLLRLAEGKGTVVSEGMKR